MCIHRSCVWFWMSQIRFVFLNGFLWDFMASFSNAHIKLYKIIWETIKSAMEFINVYFNILFLCVWWLNGICSRECAHLFISKWRKELLFERFQIGSESNEKVKRIGFIFLRFSQRTMERRLDESWWEVVAHVCRLSMFVRVKISFLRWFRSFIWLKLRDTIKFR